MGTPSLAVIGTAGRGEDQGKLTPAHYDRMVNSAIKLIDHLKFDPKELRLFSGGAAWADHVVVSLVLLGIVPPENLTLFLPAKLTYHGYEGDPLEHPSSVRTADTANHYHILFSQRIGVDTREELRKAQKLGATYEEYLQGFFVRNSKVAQQVSPDGHLLAFTFGDPKSNQQPWTIRKFSGSTKPDEAGLKDGGTADTFKKCTGTKYHARLGSIDENQIVV